MLELFLTEWSRSYIVLALAMTFLTWRDMFESDVSMLNS